MKNNNTLHRSSRALLVVYLAGATSLCVAQASAPANSVEKAGNEIEEVRVTAQHREQRLQDIPFSVSAISGEAIEAAKMIEIGDLVEVTPSLTFTHSVSSRGEGVIIRGIGTVSFSDGIEGAVGTVVDGVIIGRQSAALRDFDDIERVEVLRGPQGTLFGKNTSAGLLNIITRKPTAEFEGLIGASYASFDEFRVNGILSGPLSEDARLMGRVSAFSNTRDGVIDQRNEALNVDEMNDKSEQGVRAKLLFDATENLSVYLITEYSQQDADCCVWTERELSPNAIQIGALAPFLTASKENRDSALSNITNQESTNKGISLHLEYAHSSGATFKSITAHRRFQFDAFNDADNTPDVLIDRAGTRSKTTQSSQEFQWISPGDQRFDYVLGALVFTQRQDAVSRFSGTIVSPLAPDTGFDLLLVPELLSTDEDKVTDTLNYAIFGQATYELHERWAITAGARVLRDELDIEFLRDVETGIVPGLGLEVALPGLLGVAAQLDATEKDIAAMGMVSLQFFYNDDVTSFITVSRGYKGAGIEFSASNVQILDPESPSNVEVGIRANLLNHKLYVALTAFHTDYNDFQSSVDALGGALTTNIANVRSRGFELEGGVFPNDKLSFNFGMAYVDAIVEDFETPVNCYPGQTMAQGCIEFSPDVFGQSIEGNQLPNSPKWSANIGGSYIIHRSVGSESYISANYSWRDDALFSLAGDTNTTQSAYGLLGASLGYIDKNSGVEFSLWAKNLLDKDYAYVIFENVIFEEGYSQFNGMERHVGADVKWRF